MGAIESDSNLELMPNELSECQILDIFAQILIGISYLHKHGNLIQIEDKKQQGLGKTLQEITFKVIKNGCQSHYYSTLHQLELIEEIIRNLRPFKLENKKTNISKRIAQVFSQKNLSKNIDQHKTSDINRVRNQIIRQRGSNAIQELLEEPRIKLNQKYSNSILNLIYKEESNNVYQDDIYTPFYYAGVIVDKYQRRASNKDQENLIIINRIEKNVEEIVPDVFSGLDFYGNSSFFKILIITNGTSRKTQITQSVDQSFKARKNKNLSIKIKQAKLNSDDSAKDVWIQNLKEHNLFVLQAQEVLSLLQHGDISLDQFNLVIFDNTQEITKLDHLQLLIIKYFYFYVLHESPQINLPLIVASFVCYPVTGNENFGKLQRLFGAKRVVFSDECTAAMKGYFLSNINGYIHNKQRIFSPYCQLEKALTMITSLTNQKKLEQQQSPQKFFYQPQTFFSSGQARFYIESSFQNLKDFWASVKKIFDKYPSSKQVLSGKQQQTAAVDQAQVLYPQNGVNTRYYSYRIKNDPIIDLFLEAIQKKRQPDEKLVLSQFYSRYILSSSLSQDPTKVAQIICQKEIQSSNFVYLDFLHLLREENYLNYDLRINWNSIDSLIRQRYQIDENIKVDNIPTKIHVLQKQEEIQTENDDKNNQNKIQNSKIHEQDQLQTIEASKNPKIIEEIKEDYSTSKNKMRHFIEDVFYEVLKVSSQSCKGIQWKDRNTLDQLLRNQTQKGTPHIMELKSKMMSFLRLNFNQQDEKYLIDQINQISLDEIQVPFKDSEPNEKSQWALMFLVLCLQEENPSGCYYEMIEEMERLSFVGTSAIVLSSVIYLTITDEFKTNEKVLDLKKNIIIEKTNIQRAGKDFGFHSKKYAIRLSQTQPNPKVDSSKIVQRLAGFFSLYLGIDACLYFLIKIRAIQIPQDANELQTFDMLQKSLNQFKNNQEFQSTLTNQILNNQLGFIELNDFQQKFHNLEKLVQEFSQDFNQLEESKDNHGLKASFEESKHFFLQCVTHSSFCDVIEYKQKKELPTNHTTGQLTSFNFQRFEYLGDSILNFSIVKRIYFDTALQKNKKLRNYYTSRKLDDIKKFLTSNNFLGIQLYNQFFSINYDKIPFLYDQSSMVFSDEISKYYSCLGKWFKDKNYTDQQSRQSFSLDNYFSKKDDKKRKWQPNYHEVIDLSVKTFADVFEALIGATFIASQNLGAAINFSLNMLSSDIFQTIEQLDKHLEQEKSAVSSIYGSKPYSYSYNLAHQQQENYILNFYRKPEKDGIMIMNVYISTLLVKNIHQKPQTVNKIGSLYTDISKFLRDAYYEFESQEQNQDSRSSYQSHIGSSWLSFLHKFRNEHKLNTPDRAPENLDIFGGLAQRLLNLQQRISIEYLDSLDVKKEKLREMKKVIIDQYNKLVEEKKDDRYGSLLNLEAQRVQNKEIREAYIRCDIKNLNPVRGNIRSLNDLLETYLQPNSGELKWRVLKLYDQLHSYGELQKVQVQIDGSIDIKEGRSNSQDSQKGQNEITQDLKEDKDKHEDYTGKSASNESTDTSDSFNVKITTKQFELENGSPLPQQKNGITQQSPNQNIEVLPFS